MLSLMARPFVRRAYHLLNAKDLDGIARSFADDGLFSFPGDHELSGVYRGRDEIRDFFRRLFEWFPDLRFEPHDIAASGPPWRMRLWVRYHDSASRSGVPWDSWGTQYAHVRWRRLTADFIANDTAAVAKYIADVYAAELQPDRGAPDGTRT